MAASTLLYIWVPYKLLLVPLLPEVRHLVWSGVFCPIELLQQIEQRNNGCGYAQLGSQMLRLGNNVIIYETYLYINFSKNNKWDKELILGMQVH